MKLRCVIELEAKDPELLKQVGKLAIKAEIEEAIDNWGGQRFPGGDIYGEYDDPDPLFYPWTSVRVVGRLEEI